MITHAPCGCPIHKTTIKRTIKGILHPTAFINVKCTLCNKTWLERYEFSFNVPVNHKPFEDQV